MTENGIMLRRCRILLGRRPTGRGQRFCERGRYMHGRRYGYQSPFFICAFFPHTLCVCWCLGGCCHLYKGTFCECRCICELFSTFSVLFCRELQLIEFSPSAMNQAPTTTDSLLLKVPIWYLSIRPVLSLYIHVSPFNAPEDNAG
jgi:hypothetical protein